jgi:hypothetical protein
MNLPIHAASVAGALRLVFLGKDLNLELDRAEYVDGERTAGVSRSVWHRMLTSVALEDFINLLLLGTLRF